jgi:hypothetical protein
LGIHRLSRDFALEEWELEHRRLSAGAASPVEEAWARERLYYYEAQVQKAKAKLCDLNAPGREEWSKNLISLAMPEASLP